MKGLDDQDLDYMLNKFVYSTCVTYSVAINWWLDYCSAFKVDTFNPTQEQVRKFFITLCSLWKMKGSTTKHYKVAVIFLFN